MTILQHNPAQREFVHKLIDWKRIRSRCQQYPAIGRIFPVETLKEHCEKPPYYCHFMSWRLGTWEDESLFRRLEDLLCCAEALPNWAQEKKSLVGSADFTEYWSLIWQLQVAEHLCEVGTDVRWGKSDQSGKSPDLSVKVGDEHWYVECYTLRKSFGILKFLEELLHRFDPDIHTYYNWCLPFQLPQNSDLNRFLHEVIYECCDPEKLAKVKAAAKQESPEILYKHPESSLHVYVADDANALMPGIVPNETGEPKFYVEQVLRESVNNKKDSNALAEHRPNLLAVNCLLSNDLQLAMISPERMKSSTPPQIGPNIDVLAVYVVGIDERLDREKLNVMVRSERVEHSSLDRIASGTHTTS